MSCNFHLCLLYVSHARIDPVGSHAPHHLASKPNDAPAAGPHGWGPPLEAASKERHGSGGPNYTRRNNYRLETTD